jgi:hypothetical protein
MKKTTFILVFIFVIAKIYAQNIQISFSASGGYSSVTSVKVENLTQGTFLTLNGSDILNLTLTTEINNPDIEQQKDLQLYPNPMTNEAELTFYANQEGNVQIAVFDIFGKMVTTTQKQISDGNHTFRIVGLGQGIYMVLVFAPMYHYQNKLISMGTNTGNTQLTYIESNSSSSKINNLESSQALLNLTYTLKQSEQLTKKISKLKSSQATVNMPYTINDQLRFTGSNGSDSAVITDVPTQSKTLTFNIVDKTPPAEVTNLKATQGDSKVTLTWTDPTVSDYQKVVITYLSETIEVAKGMQTKEITNLANGTLYNFVVKTIDTNGNNSSGSTINGTPVDLTPPAEVTNLKVTQGDSKVTLTWTDPTTSDYQKAVITYLSETIEVAKGLQTKEITNLANGTLYNFVVKTIDTNGNNSNGSAINGTPIDLTPPDEVTNLMATTGDGTVTLTWTDPTTSDYQKVEIAYLLDTIEVAKGLQTKEITNLTNGTLYDFVVKTIDTNENKSSGTQISKTPEAPLSVTCLASCSSMSWKIVGEIGSYSKNQSCSSKYSIIGGQAVESERDCSGTITFSSSGHVYNYTANFYWSSCTMYVDVTNVGSCSDSKKKSGSFNCKDGNGTTFIEEK